MDTSDMTVKDDSTSSKITGRRPGRPSSNISPRQRQERSRQSARECRSRKNVRYQYLEQLVNIKEKSVYKLRKELEMHRRWCEEIDNGVISEDLVKGLSIDPQKTSQLTTTEQSNLPLPRERSLSLPTTSKYQTCNLGLTSAKGIPKATSNNDSKLYKLLTGRMTCTQSFSPEDTANEFHLNRTNSLSSGDKMRHPYKIQSHSKEGTSNMRHPYTTQSKTAVESYNMFHQNSELPIIEDTSNVYTQQQNGSIFEKVSPTTAQTENQHTASFSSLTKFETKSQEQVPYIDNYKLDPRTDFENLSVLSKGDNTYLASRNTNQSSDECNIPKIQSDINLLNEKSNADDTSSEMEFVDWILKNQSNLSSDSALIESARQLEDTAIMVDIFSEDQPDVADISPAQIDMLYSEDNNIDTTNNLNVTLAESFHGNIKIIDIEAPKTVESLLDNVLPSKTLHYMSTLPNMLNHPTYSSNPWQRSTSADCSLTTSNSIDTLVSKSHPLDGAFNHIDLSAAVSKSNAPSMLHGVNIQLDQSRTSENFKESKRQNVSLNNLNPVVIASASTSCEILPTSENSSYTRANNEEAINTSLHPHSVSEEIRHDTGPTLKRSHSAGDTPHPNVQNKFPFLSFLLKQDDEI
ncbi:uncharacterized protein LOC134691131 isoform X2 [Mytilus trossulus]|uniref:uncharacterized protein LOC134691131 isoform X2 n=1 Tax=Mytilus trossulus TaxID=6551 RepID=UPI003005A8F9